MLSTVGVSAIVAICACLRLDKECCQWFRRNCVYPHSLNSHLHRNTSSSIRRTVAAGPTRSRANYSINLTTTNPTTSLNEQNNGIILTFTGNVISRATVELPSSGSGNPTNTTSLSELRLDDGIVSSPTEINSTRTVPSPRRTNTTVELSSCGSGKPNRTENGEGTKPPTYSSLDHSHPSLTQETEPSPPSYNDLFDSNENRASFT